MATSYDTFEYRPLEDVSRDIRLLRLMPGSGNQTLALQIFHTRLDVPAPCPTHQTTLEELQETLPSEDWEVVETFEERYLFYNRQKRQSQWHHPDPAFDRTLYEWQDPYPGLEPIYEALSYAWGTEEATDPVSIEDTGIVDYIFFGNQQNDKRKTILLRLNLCEALMEMRELDTPRVLWVDAICIDQQDNSEKNEQVSVWAQSTNSLIGLSSGDTLVTVLGLGALIILRPVRRFPASFPPTYQFVCNTNTPGLSYGEPLLGPLSPSYRLALEFDAGGFESHAFINLSTKEKTYDDPRKGALEDFVDEEGRVGEWEYDAKFSRWKRGECWYRNKRTGEVTAKDPRTEKWVLEKRGVVFEKFILL
ncbi:hypothetical protein P154DRAFT_581813 [Amniculicola lignicola CBS 123094]|uniref:WW domain-containing protein n=1 Tax=Amniculicola lignicola CBS 123094 TaxID=1392246 RepID=A0A6A5VZT9_9PLEO|nr:hypothetical protein P154DRAFT_581813 [Amniculicola lignicola CBS 123094]